MKKDKFLMVRVNDADREQYAATQQAGGWKTLSDMVRELVSRAQSLQPPQPTAQHPRDHQPDAPPL